MRSPSFAVQQDDAGCMTRMASHLPRILGAARRIFTSNLPARAALQMPCLVDRSR